MEDLHHLEILEFLSLSCNEQCLRGRQYLTVLVFNHSLDPKLSASDCDHPPSAQDNTRSAYRSLEIGGHCGRGWGDGIRTIVMSTMA